MAAKTTAQKLLIKPGAALWTSDPERGAVVGPLPDGVVWADGPEISEVALLLVSSRSEAESLAEMLLAKLSPATIVWVLYPKGNRADVNRDSLWPILGARGWRPITQVAVDEIWSALRFRPLKPDEAPWRAEG